MKPLLRLAQQGLSLHDDSRRLDQYLEWWLEEIVATSRRPSTIQSYREKVRLHISPVIGHIRLGKLTAGDVQTLINRKRKEGLSARTVAYIHAVLRRALTIAVRYGYASQNVAKLVETPTSSRPEVEPLTAEDARSLLRAASGHRLYALYSVALAIGLRRGEALGLRWSDVDFENATLTVRQALQRIDGQLVFVEPKSKRSRRTIPLPASCLEALRQHKVSQLEERLALGNEWRGGDLVFTSQVGTPIEPRNLSRHFESLCKRADIPRKRFHDLRVRHEALCHRAG